MRTQDGLPLRIEDGERRNHDAQNRAKRRFDRDPRAGFSPTYAECDDMQQSVNRVKVGLKLCPDVRCWTIVKRNSANPHATCRVGVSARGTLLLPNAPHQARAVLERARILYLPARTISKQLAVSQPLLNSACFPRAEPESLAQTARPRFAQTGIGKTTVNR